MKGIAFFCVMLLAAAALAINTAPYFPIVIGHEWVYQDSTSAGYDTITTEITGTTTIDGRETFIFMKTGGETPDSSLNQVRTDGFYNMFNMEVEMAGLSITNVPVKFLKNPASVGDSWVALDIDTNVVIMTFPVHVVITVDAVFEGFESITVPRGEFRDCIKILSTATWNVDAGAMFSDSGVDVYSLSYFAENVGLVYETTYNIIGSITGGGSSATTSQLLSYDFTNIQDAPNRPSDVAICAFPNPFNSEVNIELRGADFDRVEIYDLGGRLVESLDNPEENSLRWSPEAAVQSGVYFIKAVSGSSEFNTRAVYLK